MEISFLKDDTSDTASDTLGNQLNFSILLSDPSDPPSPPNCKKRKRSPDLTNIIPNKKPRTSSTKETTASLHSIDENTTLKQKESNTVNKNDMGNNKHISSKTQQPLRRSARLQNKRNKQELSTSESSSNSNDSLRSISLPLSKLKLNKSTTETQSGSISNDSIDIKHKSVVNIKCDKTKIHQQPFSEWDEFFPSKSLTLKWDSKATPIKSSLKINKRKKRIKSNSKKVNWGNVQCQTYEQRAGILSCGVPSEYGPSLHLGKLISTTTSKLDQYEIDKKENHAKWKGELNKRERINRVKQFSPKDVNTRNLKEDTMEIKYLRESRTDIGCKCISVYKMKKDQIIGRIVYLKGIEDENMDKKQERKKLGKLKKNDVFEILIKLQFEKYGRYDVCCIDKQCSCFKEGIECQIDSDCCKCGGDTVYNNYLKLDGDAKKDKKVKKVNKKNSLSCGNPNGNTLRVSVMDYVDIDGKLGEDEIVKTAESSFLSFTSPFVKKTISDWNQHYNEEQIDDDDDDQNKENKENHVNVRKSLKFV